MKKIKLQFFGNFVLTIALIFTVLFTIGLGIFSKYFIGGEDGQLVFYTVCVMVALQIPTEIFLIRRISVGICNATITQTV